MALSCVSAAGLALVAAPAVAAPKAPTKPRVTFGVQPATSTSRDARPHYSFGATPGAFLTDHVAVLNYSSRPLSLQLYATDAINTANGGFGLLVAGQKPTGVGAWITLPKRSATVRVPAQSKTAPGQVIVPFVLRVPANATPGDHVGGIVASLQTEGQNSSGQNVVLDQRVGTRVFIRVSGTLAPKLTLTNLHASYHGTLDPIGKGRVTVHYTLTNAGNVELGVNQGVSVTGLFGGSHHVTIASEPLLLPGDSVEETAQLSGGWPQFVVHAKVTAHPVAAPGDHDPQLSPVTASTHAWAVPWTLLVLVIVLLGLIGAGIVARRRRSNPSAPPAAVNERVSA
jgi:hypothetical protein